MSFAFCAIVIPSTAGANLITNASFEDGLSGWNTSGVVSGLSCGPIVDCWWVHTGERSATLTPIALQVNSSVRQTLSGLSAGEYEFGAYVRISSFRPVANWDQIQVSVFGDGIDEVAGTDPNAVRDRIGADGVFATTDWILLSGIFTAGPGATALFNLNFQNFSEAITGVIVDDAFVRPVPEPATLILIFLGLAGIGLVRIHHGVARD